MYLVRRTRLAIGAQPIWRCARDTYQLAAKQPDSFQSPYGVDRREVVLGGSALLAAATLAGVALPSPANAQVPKPGVDPTPGFNNKIPDKILTPDKVETRIGTLNFVDGVPTDETARRPTTISTSCAVSRSSST